MKKLKDNIGATSIEYAILSSFIGVAIISSFNGAYCKVSLTLAEAVSSTSTFGCSNASVPSNKPVISQVSLDAVKNMLDESQGGYNNASTYNWNYSSYYGEDVVGETNSLIDQMSNYNNEHPGDNILEVYGIYTLSDSNDFDPDNWAESATNYGDKVPVTDYKSVITLLQGSISDYNKYSSTSDFGLSQVFAGTNVNFPEAGQGKTVQVITSQGNILTFQSYLSN